MKTRLPALTLCALSAAFAGCAPKIDIGSATSPAEFTQDREQLPREPGGTPVEFVVIRAGNMKEGASYAFNNVNVAIIGDIPKGVTIDGNNGQLKIGGNIGEDVRIRVNVPHTICPAVGVHIVVNLPCPDGALPPFDKIPAIDIFGDVPASTRVTSTGKIVQKPIW